MDQVGPLGHYLEVSAASSGRQLGGRILLCRPSTNYQQADTGTKMIHLGKNTSSTVISKTISAAHGNNSYRGMVKVMPRAENARNYTQCDSLLIGNQCGAHTFPLIEVRNKTASVEH